MTILKLLNGETMKILRVDIIKKISPFQFIVADATGMAIVNVTLESNHQKHIVAGKSIKVIKPFKVEDKVITWDPKSSPIQLKLMQTEIDNDELRELESKEKNNSKT